MAQTTGGPHRGHAAGDSDLEKQASQLASDVKYKVKQRMGSSSNMNPAQVSQAYLSQLAKSPAPSAVKALAKQKLGGGLKEEYSIKEFAQKSVVNALLQVFAEGIGDEKKWIVVTDKKTGNRYRRQADRAKISELRSNPNIASVEITDYHPKETDDKQGKKTSKVKSGKGLDPVGKEDADVNNNGVSNDKSDKYLLKRRAAVGNAIASRTGTQKEEFIPEAKKAKKKDDKITGEGVNNSNVINLKPTMEQTETDAPVKKSSQDEEQKKKLKIRQQQVQTALTRQRQTMQLQRSGRLPLNYSEDNNQEGDDIQEVAPPGFEGTVKAMKKYPELSRGKTSEGKDKNIYALAWFMKNKGFKSHKTASGADKQVQKSHYEPEGEMIGEEESDRMRDRQLERGGMGARSSSAPAKTGTSKPVDPKKQAETRKKALDLVRQSIIAKHGKSALM